MVHLVSMIFYNKKQDFLQNQFNFTKIRFILEEVFVKCLHKWCVVLIAKGIEVGPSYRNFNNQGHKKSSFSEKKIHF